MSRRAILSIVPLLAATLSGHAATPAAGTVTPEAPATWSGSFSGEHPLLPVPEVRCLEGACDTFSLTTSVGDLSDYAIEISIRFTYDGVTDLDLIVSHDGAEIARSVAVDSNAESVLLPGLPDGTYTVTVIPTNTINPDGDGDDVAYEGLAEVVRLPAAGDGADLLPNLISLPPHNFHISTAANLVPFPENPLLSCYPEETIENPAHPTRCLRFDQTIANVGAGKLELRFAMDQALSPDPDDQRLVQRIYTDDGSYRERIADSYELHAAHGHVHYRGFGQSKLYPFDWASQSRSNDGIPASVGNKVGFCVIDVLLLDAYWGADDAAPDNGPRSHTFPTCNAPRELNDDGLWMVQGIDVGWADVYGWNLADQYIDVTGVPDGVYQIEQIANPNGSVTEVSTADNVATTVICLLQESAHPVTSAAEAAACGA